MNAMVLNRQCSESGTSVTRCGFRKLRPGQLPVLEAEVVVAFPWDSGGTLCILLSSLHGPLVPSSDPMTLCAVGSYSRATWETQQYPTPRRVSATSSPGYTQDAQGCLWLSPPEQSCAHGLGSQVSLNTPPLLRGDLGREWPCLWESLALGPFCQGSLPLQGKRCLGKAGPSQHPGGASR